MLRRFSVKNFYSIYEKLEFSLLLTGAQQVDNRITQGVEGDNISKIMLIAGHNASGKTNILKVLSFLPWFMLHSFHQLQPKEAIPLEPHFGAVDEPSEFELEFEHRQQIWRYQLTLTKERVLHESLHRKGYRFAYVFTRDWISDKQAYEIKVKKELGFALAEAEKTRQNCSLISTAAQYGVPLALGLLEMTVQTNLNALGRRRFGGVQQLLTASQFYNQNTQELQKMSTMLAEWDLGLQSVLIEKQEKTNKDNEKETTYVPYGVHSLNGQEHVLELWKESSGTRSAFVLLSLVLPVLNKGGLVVIDELESDLHPHMLDAVLELFLSPSKNPYNAQIIFSTHSHDQMGLLRKEQIMLVEKDEQLNTWAYTLGEVAGVRTDDNFYAKYMSGAYGGVPEI